MGFVSGDAFLLIIVMFVASRVALEKMLALGIDKMRQKGGGGTLEGTAVLLFSLPYCVQAVVAVTTRKRNDFRLLGTEFRV